MTELPDYTDRRSGSTRFVIGVKLAPGIPMFVKNYGLGMSGVPFRTFFVATMVLTGCYAAAFVVIGESLLDHEPSKTVIAVVVLGALVGMVMWYRRRKSERAELAVST